VGDKYIQLPIPDIEDMGIVLKDILEDIPVDKEVMPYMTGTYDGASRLEKGIFNFTDQDKAKCLTTKTGHGNKYLIHRPCEIRKEWTPKNDLQWDIHEEEEEEGQELKDFTEETKCHHVATATDVEGHDMNKRVYANTGKAPCLHTRAGETKILDDDDRFDQLTYRKLTVTECARLQTVPDSYMEDCFDEKGKPVSDTQKFKALGNGWTVAVIVHILQGMRYIVKD
jgi:site-specific DNA-cytosine methylase